MPKPNTARRADRLEPARTRAVRRAMPNHEVLRRLHQLLEESEPSVAVGEDLINDMRDATEDIISGGDLRCYGTYLQFQLILGHMIESRHGAKCGIALLRFMGCLSRALEEQGPVKLSVVRAIELMTHFQDWRYLIFAQHGDRWWIESTPEGDEAFGSRIRIRLPREPSTGEWLPEVFEDLVGYGYDDPEGR